MQRTAVFWIRDGVLIDRMPVNAVAFAVACLACGDAGIQAKVSFTELVNFAFENSGISCAEKMSRFNEAHELLLLPDIMAASSCYNRLASEAGSHCRYFAGICGLIKELTGIGILNFITSAVEQPVLDVWGRSSQGSELAPYLTEVLGRRENFSKGRDHFSYVREKYSVERFLYVADAVAEIENGSHLAEEFNIFPVGFANVISSLQVEIAHELVLKAYSDLQPAKIPYADFVLNSEKLELPNEVQLVGMLNQSKAVHTVSGDSAEIVNSLSAYFAGFDKD